MGPGILNALYCTDRAIELAGKYGIGLVGLNNTTHWMRGGTYGRYAASKGYVAISWTNTESVMPPWGASECRLGNNPYVMAAPSFAKDGEPVVLDMAMSLYSYGKLQVTGLAGKKLPFPGGFDSAGKLTDDPAAIEQTKRMLPIGYWKGSSFSFMLDILAAVLSDGAGAAKIDTIGKGSCGGASQIFIIIDPSQMTAKEYAAEVIAKAQDYIKTAQPAENTGAIQWPGEGSARTRRENLAQGIPVNDSVWKEIIAL
jgi:3-dehydro-L-gulonate 2-dehydrogenase